MSDPLAAFWYCRHSESGERVSRLIKPGKQTPYDADGDLHVETGRQLERQPNGRYRHVASYSIQELVAMGWDGAMYVSTNVAQQMLQSNSNVIVAAPLCSSELVSETLTRPLV